MSPTPSVFALILRIALSLLAIAFGLFGFVALLAHDYPKAAAYFGAALVLDPAIKERT